MNLMRFKNFEGILRFDDGVNIDTSGELRKKELKDGWYIVGEGLLIPVKDEAEADQMLRDLIEDKNRKK